MIFGSRSIVGEIRRPLEAWLRPARAFRRLQLSVDESRRPIEAIRRGTRSSPRGFLSVDESRRPHCSQAPLLFSFVAAAYPSMRVDGPIAAPIPPRSRWSWRLSVDESRRLH